MSSCARALLEARDSAEYGSAQWILGSPDMGESRTAVCRQLVQCQWEETGDVNWEFTVASRRAYEDCYRLVFSQFD